MLSVNIKSLWINYITSLWKLLLKYPKQFKIFKETKLKIIPYWAKFKNFKGRNHTLLYNFNIHNGGKNLKY